MKKFKFGLEPLLRLRKIEENVALTGLAKVMIRVNRAEEDKAESKRQISHEMDIFTRRKSSEVTIDDYKIYNKYLDRLNSEISRADKTLEILKPDVEREQKKVVDARLKKRVVEILKERKKEVYDYNLKKKEKKQMEELQLLAKEGRKEKWHKISEKYHDVKIIEADEYEHEEEFESSGFEIEKSGRSEKEDVVSEYFKKYGIEDPRKKK